MVEVPVRQADGDRLLDGRGHGAPRAPEQPRDLLPGQRAGPRCQRHQQCVRHLLLPTHPGHRLDMHAGASRAPHAARRVAQRHRDPPQRYMAEAPYWTGVSVRAPRPTLAASGHEAAVWGQLGHQSARVSRHRHDPKPLQFHRRLDQTFQEHESPLRYPGCVTTPKYLMRLMFFNSQPSSACIHLYDEPEKKADPVLPRSALICLLPSPLRRRLLYPAELHARVHPRRILSETWGETGWRSTWKECFPTPPRRRASRRPPSRNRRCWRPSRSSLRRCRRRRTDSTFRESPS